MENEKEVLFVAKGLLLNSGCYAQPALGRYPEEREQREGALARITDVHCSAAGQEGRLECCLERQVQVTAISSTGRAWPYPHLPALTSNSSYFTCGLPHRARNPEGVQLSFQGQERRTTEGAASKEKWREEAQSRKQAARSFCRLALHMQPVPALGQPALAWYLPQAPASSWLPDALVQRFPTVTSTVQSHCAVQMRHSNVSGS
ncbi:hypothetical protein P7K49_036861 [Saguinus oedipus]|uniref:Uncharacterized protein n=1 Tax=Saguinus oedipus TaxID=9490 RepID=A0ABQ9TLB8_SAGOE|nr:hypothetical protein P7K49_036861 [Saguinus oedipus]